MTGGRVPARRRRPWLTGALALPLLLAGDGRLDAEPEGAGAVVDLIVDAGARRGLDVRRMLRVAWRESRYDPAAYNRWSGASGVFQFLPGTWRRVAPLAGFAGWSPFDAYANVETAAYLMGRPDLGGWGHWRATDW